VRTDGIYVEARIRADTAELWRLTQTPDLHERWDLRFSEIRYLPRASEAEPQRFRYSTRLGFGLRIDGWGESVGTKADEHGRGTSALEFGSDDSKSLIRSGAGYWKYVPDGDVVRFITGYDYEPRWGALGRVIDRLAFRPLIGWATAWSFDRLRLWAERGIDPALSAERALVHSGARIAVALVWLYHGLVPKLLFPHPAESAMLISSGVPEAVAVPLVGWIGLAEVLLGLLLLTGRAARPLLLLTALLMIVAAATVVITTPGFALAPFNPITLNFAVLALAFIGWRTAKDLPSARRCARRP